MCENIIKDSKAKVMDIACHKDVHHKKFAHLGLMLVTVITVMLAMSVVCFAAGDDAVTTAVKTGLGDVWGVVQVISVPVGVVALAICGYNFFFGGERGVEKGRKILIYTIIGLAVIWLAPVLMQTAQGWFQNANGSVNVFR